MKYHDQKIIHRRSMRDFLLENGGVLIKTKKDLKNPKRDIYIFKYSSIKDIIGNYRRTK